MWTRVLVASVLLTAGCSASTRAQAKPALATARPVVETVAATGSVTALGDGKVHSASAARKLADAALDLLTLPAGSTRLGTKPKDGATSVGIETVVTSQVTRDRWWSVPGTVADAAAWLTENAPTGLTVTQPQPGYLSWAGLPWFPMDGYLAQDGDHVDVSISTQVIWAPLKTPIETVPASVTSAQLDYLQGSNTFGHDSRHVVTGAALGRLRDAINVNVPGYEGARSCPADDGGTATVTMRYGGHAMVFTISLTGCRGIEVTSDGRSQPELDCCAQAPPNTSLDRVVDTLAQTPTTPATKADPVPRRLLIDRTSVPQTLAIDKGLLATLVLPAEAMRDKAPHGEPVDFRDPNQHLVEATQWWTLPLTRAAALSWVTGHLPRGLALAHVGTDYYGSTVVVEQLVGVYPSPVDLVITLAGHGSTTRVQVVARKFYLPTRTAAETIPVTIRTAQLSVQIGKQPTRRVHYREAGLALLIRYLNSRPASWGGTSCTTTGPDSKLGVLFHVGGHTINFYWYGDSCDMIAVVDGKSAPYLTGPPTALVERLVKETKS